VRGGPKVIEQHSNSTGAYRYSTDNGKTWQPGRAPVQTAQ
jgi:Neuraminidase (sialidase)